MKIKYIIKYLIVFIIFNKALFFPSASFSKEPLCGNNTIQFLIDEDVRNTEYNETRNDSGIHFEFDWNKNKRDKIIIKRNKENYPIIRYSLFDTKNFEPSKTAIKKINNKGNKIKK